MVRSGKSSTFGAFSEYFLISAILGYGVFLYYTFVVIHWEKGSNASDLEKLFLGFFHISIMMAFWSFITVIITDPGQVPLFWVYLSS